MIDIFELNQSLIGSPALERTEDNTLCIERNTNPESIPGLSPQQANDLRQLNDFISECVPDDFDFELSLGNSGPTLRFFYDDGPTTESVDPFLFSTSEELYLSLPCVDWDTKRGELLKRQQIYDEMLEIAAKRPVDIPSVKFLRQQWKVVVKRFHRSALREGAECKVLIAFPPGSECDSDRPDFTMPSMDTLIQSMGEAMMYGGLVVSLCIRGRALASSEVEGYKRRALEQLPPISRAIAEGRWPFDILAERGYVHVSGC